MDGRLIFLHHVGRLMAPGRCLEGERVIRHDACRKAEGIYDPEVIGKPVKKSRRRTTNVTVLKLTQVGEMSILRRSRERS